MRRFVLLQLTALLCLAFGVLLVSLLAVAIDRDQSWFRIVRLWIEAVVFLWAFVLAMTKSYGGKP